MKSAGERRKTKRGMQNGQQGNLDCQRKENDSVVCGFFQVMFVYLHNRTISKNTVFILKRCFWKFPITGTKRQARYNFSQKKKGESLASIQKGE